MSEYLISERAVSLLIKEYGRAVNLNGPFNSAHEGYAVIKEELDELWEEVRKKRGNRDMEKMLKEAIQVSAMGLRFAVDICREILIMGEDGEEAA